jgi:hypothetical protein
LLWKPLTHFSNAMYMNYFQTNPDQHFAALSFIVAYFKQILFDPIIMNEDLLDATFKSVTQY